MKNEIVTLATFQTAAEAEIAATMLRSMGIETQVTNQIQAAMLPYYNDNTVKLLVNSSDYDKAEALLNAKPTKE
ncbi:MAG: DUF2007 domain-containing protein [Tidjanibacter sp.]|nr:DUF2007 domain-containing protein [Tidjanibacter sp.]